MPNDPPNYNDVMKVSHQPTAPLLEARVEIGTPFSSIFGVATNVQFEHNASSAGTTESSTVTVSVLVDWIS